MGLLRSDILLHLTITSQIFHSGRVKIQQNENFGANNGNMWVYHKIWNEHKTKKGLDDNFRKKS